MSMPPNMNSADLFAQIIAVPRPHRLVPFPRNNPDTSEPICEVAMVILSQQEAMVVASEAEKVARKLLKNDMPNKEELAKGYNDVYNNASAVEVLYRSCKDPNDLNRSFFPSKQAIGDVLSSDEIAILLNHYFTMNVELGPIVGVLTEDEMQAWIKKLAEGGGSSQYFLNSFSWEALKGLVTAMAIQLFSSPTAKSLPGLPPEENTTEDKPAKKAKSKT